MVPAKDDTDGRLPKMSMQKMFTIIMDELVGTRRELKEDMAEMKKELKSDILLLQSDVKSLRTDVKTLRTDFGTLRIVVHQNQLTFMKNHDDLEQWVTVLATKVA